MALKYAPNIGTLMICDFRETIAPEICKKRPVVLLANNSHRLCTVVPCSTTSPQPVEPWHYLIHTQSPLPKPYSAAYYWVKCDMVFVASFDRLTIPFNGKDANGKRKLVVQSVSEDELNAIRRCVAKALFPGLVLDN
jgi:mRNA interferase MazF